MLIVADIFFIITPREKDMIDKTPTSRSLWVYGYLLQILGSVDLNAGAHGGDDDAGTDILALGSCGLSLHNSLNQASTQDEA